MSDVAREIEEENPEAYAGEPVPDPWTLPDPPNTDPEVAVDPQEPENG